MQSRAIALTAQAAVAAQAYPERPVRVVVPAMAGGAFDVVARQLMQKLGESLNAQFIVDNRGGAAGRTRAVNRAPACGM